MKIRRLERTDFDQVIELGLKFAEETGFASWQQSVDPDHVKKILLTCFMSNTSFVAENQGQIVGMLLSVKTRDTWIPTVIRVKEMAWWVAPEQRQSQIGPQLLDAYIEEALQQKSQGQIVSFSIGLYRHSPKFLEEYFKSKGFKFLESTFTIGE